MTPSTLELQKANDLRNRRVFSRICAGFVIAVSLIVLYFERM
jgi:hypothetical protein